MALRGKTACLWHAYNTLVEQSGKNAALKGQLKVLTHNLASLFKLTDIEKTLETYFSTSDVISFPEYLDFLRKELVQPLINADPNNVTSILSLDHIDNVCWYICSSFYQKQIQTTLKDNDVYKLWRLFNFLAETDDADEALYPVVIDHEEAEIICERIMMIMRMEYRKINFETGHNEQLHFVQFLTLITECCFLGKEHLASSAIAELFDDQVTEVLKKGFLHRKGHGFTGGWKDHWCVLSLSQFCLYSNRDETELKDSLIITKSCGFEDVTEKQGIAIMNIGFNTRGNKFNLSAENQKVFELSAADQRTKTEWLTAIQTAFDWSLKETSPRQTALHNRKKERAEKREQLKRETEERLRKEEEIANARLALDAEKRARLDMEERMRQEEARRMEDQQKMEETMKLLELEKLARIQAELQRQEEANLAELRKQQLIELEMLQQELEALLKQERQAKENEEIIRAMQARILQEEFERREQLEKMQADLEKMLQEEQLRNIGLEEDRKKQELFIHEEQEKLKALELERIQQGEEHQAAIIKLQEAEILKARMEEQLKKKEEEARLLKRPADINLSSHRGVGAFVQADYTKRNDLTPQTPITPVFNVLRICRTPLSPPVLPPLSPPMIPDIIHNIEEKSSTPPPIPPKCPSRKQPQKT